MCGYLCSCFRSLFWNPSRLIFLRVFSCNYIISKLLIIQKFLRLFFCHTSDIRHCNLLWWTVRIFCHCASKWFEYSGRLTNRIDCSDCNNCDHYSCKNLHKLMHTGIYLSGFPSAHILRIIGSCIKWFCIIIVIIQIFVCHDHRIGIPIGIPSDPNKISIRIHKWMLQILYQLHRAAVSAFRTFLCTFHNDLFQTIWYFRYQLWWRCNFLLQMLHCNFYSCLSVKWNPSCYHFEQCNTDGIDITSLIAESTPCLFRWCIMHRSHCIGTDCIRR